MCANNALKLCLWAHFPRAKIERDYGENLVNLARRASGKDEIGTLRRSWDQLKAGIAVRSLMALTAC